MKCLFTMNTLIHCHELYFLFISKMFLMFAGETGTIVRYHAFQALNVNSIKSQICCALSNKYAVCVCVCAHMRIFVILYDYFFVPSSFCSVRDIRVHWQSPISAKVLTNYRIIWCGFARFIVLKPQTHASPLPWALIRISPVRWTQSR